MESIDEKPRPTSYISAVPSPYEPYTEHQSIDVLPRWEKEDQVYKHRIRILRLASRITALILSAIITSMMAYTLARYFLTRTHILPHGRAIWPTPMTVWPSIMLLAIAIVGFITNLFALSAYICGISCANKTNSIGGFIEYATLVGKFIAWVLAMILFRITKTDNSIWGWTCNDEVQAQTMSFMHFGRLCNLQTGSWCLSVLHAIGYLLTFIVLVFVTRRSSTEKKLETQRASQGPFQLGNVGYKFGIGQRYIPLSGTS